MKSNKSESSYMLNTISTLSQSQTSFFLRRPKFLDYPLLEQCFKSHSFEIFQFLDKDDIENLKRANKLFCNICDCHLLLEESLSSLGKLFSLTVNETTTPIKKTSKLREKYNFNKPMEQYYKNSKEYKKRIQSGMRRNKK